MSIIIKAKNAVNYNPLIGNTIFDETEYEELLNITRLRSKEYLNNSELPIRRDHEIIFVALVEITKRWEKDETGFWDYVINTILGLEKGSTYVNKLRTEYIRIMNCIRNDYSVIFAKEGNIYYATLMLHALATTKSICAFLDLCYNIFRVDLNFNYTENDKDICKLATSQFCKVLMSSVGNEKPISIGTNSYSVKIGLRRLALDSETQNEFIGLLDEALKKINSLFYRQSFNYESYFDKLISNWWEFNLAKIAFAQKTNRSSIHFVSKNKINVKFLRIDHIVYLVIPPIRLEENFSSSIWLSVYAGNSLEQRFSKELFTKKEKTIIITTQQEDIILNDLFQGSEQIKLRIKITENNTVLFDKTIEKEFILFEGESEILSKLIKVNNYFLYSRNIDSIKTPSEIYTHSAFLYNIYPKEGETISGETHTIHFLDVKTPSMNKYSVRLNGILSNCKWSFENNEYIVCNKPISLLIHNEILSNGLELRVNKNNLSLSELTGITVDNYCLFDITAYLPTNQPIMISVYSFLNKKYLFEDSIILFNNFNFTFNKNHFYGNDEKILTISTNGENEVVSWNNKQKEILYPCENGEIIIKIPYFKWRIDNKEWHNEPLFKELWHKDSYYQFHYGSILQIDADINIENFTMFSIADYISKEKIENKSIGIFEIGKYIVANETKKEQMFFLSGNCDSERYELFKITTEEHFCRDSKPLLYSDGKLYWLAKNSFIGNNTRLFKLEIFRNKHEPIYYGDLSLSEEESIKIEDGIYSIKISSKNENIFKNEEIIFFEDEIIIGSEEKYRFSNKKIKIIAASFAYSENIREKEEHWNYFKPEYYLSKIEYKEHNNEIYYLGNLVTKRFTDGAIKFLNKMEDDKGIEDQINPIRIDIMTDNELEISAGYDKNDHSIYLEALYYDKDRNSICNKTENRNRYRYISRYKYEVNDV